LTIYVKLIFFNKFLIYFLYILFMKIQNENICSERRPAFTLIELIVVITILAILWTIAFISLQWYSAQARDSKRLSDISNIKKSLELFSLNTWKYPEPDDSFTVSYSWEILRNQWIVWDQVSTNLSRNLNEKPIDPLTENEYIYSRTYGGTEYEVLGLYESDLISNVGANLVFAQQSNAATQDYSKIDWNYNWIYVKTPSFYVPTPSLINAELKSNGDLADNTVKSQITTWWDNIPWISTWWLDINFSYYEWTITENSTDTEKINLVQAIQTSYSWSMLANNTSYLDILSRTSTWEMVDFVDVVVLNRANWANVSADTTWCYYKNNTFSDTLWWTSNELKYDELNNKCYIFWDEDTNAINACNTWVSENISSSAWDFIWVPARYFITDWNGTWMNDSFYEREVIYNGNTYVCRWFAVAKYEMSYDEETASDSSSVIRETRRYSSSKVPISMANRLSIVDINQPQAIAHCGDIWTHLITNNEWMTIAKNIEQQWVNWTNGNVWDWFIFNGYSNDTTKWCKWNFDWTRAEPTWTDCDWTNRNQLNLSNWNIILDLAWNVREHVNKTNDILSINWTQDNYIYFRGGSDYVGIISSDIFWLSSSRTINKQMRYFGFRCAQ